MSRFEFHSRRAARVVPLLVALASTVSAAESIDPPLFAPDGNVGFFWFRSATLEAPMADPSLYFGISVDMSGDFLVVGSQASAEDGSSLAGRVYVYRRAGPEWQLETSLVSPAGAEQGGLFGNSVAMANTPEGVVLAVGEPGRDVLVRGNVTADAGAVWLYERIDGVWEQTELTAAPSENALLGFSVDTDGSHVIAGAPGHENNHGQIVVWRREGEGWTTDHSLTALEVGANVGYSVAIAGDRALVGAPGASYIGDDNAGAALILPLLVDSEPGSSVIFDPTPEAGETFGTVVAATPDRFAVGSIHDDAPGGDADSGAVHVFWFDGDDEHLYETFRSLIPQQGARFGSSLAFAGERLVIGEPFREVSLFGNALTYAGAMHLFRETPETEIWVYENSVYSFAEGEMLGWSVTADAHRVAAGIPARPHGAQPSAGAVDVFEADLIFADGFD